MSETDVGEGGATPTPIEPIADTDLSSGTDYRILTDIDWPGGHASAGEVVEALPKTSIEWLTNTGAIAVVGSEGDTYVDPETALDEASWTEQPADETVDETANEMAVGPENGVGPVMPGPPPVTHDNAPLGSEG